jgi:predicted nucleic acid-binding protein
VIVYIESTFLLRLALLQERHASCDDILGLCETGDARLVIPSFCLTEPYDNLRRRQAQRQEMKLALDEEFKQLAPTSSLTKRLGDFRDLTSLLIDSADEEIKRLDEVSARVLGTAEVIPVDGSVLNAAKRHRDANDLSFQDAVVYASILSHLDRFAPEASCFIDEDKDFSDPDLVKELAQRRCKLIFRFDHGLEHLRDSLHHRRT